MRKPLLELMRLDVVSCLSGAGGPYDSRAQAEVFQLGYRLVSACDVAPRVNSDGQSKRDDGSSRAVGGVSICRLGDCFETHIVNFLVAA